MAFPAIQKFTAAGQLLNQTITFTSLNQTLSAYISIIILQAIAKGYTCVGSSNGTTAALDGVNRWSATAAVRGATTTTAQSWLIMQAANGAQTLFFYTGASDDICGIACSPSGAYALAGTATFKPTATDECIGIQSASIVGATASANRVADVWIDSAHNGWRACIFRSNVLVGPMIWCELFDPLYVISPATISVPVWCGCLAPGSLLANNIFGAYSANAAGGQTRITVSGTPTTVNLGASGKVLGNNFSAENGVAQELNGNNFLYRPVGLSSATTNARGDVGNRYDFYYDQELLAAGQLDAGKNWVYIGNNAVSGAGIGILWPWDGVSAWVGA